MPRNLSVIVPTYNECNNVEPLVREVYAVLDGIDFEIIFVDDNSPDGTAAKVREVQQQNDRVELLVRTDSRGLSGACIEGILLAQSPLVAVIDGDLQHDQTKLITMYQQLQEDPELDIVIGSRHTGQGTTGEGLSAIRKFGSRIATLVTKLIVPVQLTDPMSGFFMVRRASFVHIATRLQPQGFKILADMLACSKGSWKHSETGYTFRPRQHGESKMDTGVALELLSLLLSHMSFGTLSLRFILFVLVGLSGVIVQLVATSIGLLIIDRFLYAQIFGVICAMTSNYMLNNNFTYRDTRLQGLGMIKGLFSFYLICTAGAFANVAIADLLFKYTDIWYLASLTGAAIAALWNFLFNSVFTWKVR